MTGPAAAPDDPGAPADVEEEVEQPAASTAATTAADAASITRRMKCYTYFYRLTRELSIFPLSALVCVVVGRFVLSLFLPQTHLLDIAVPLLFSLMLVRVVVYVLRRVFGPSGLLRQWERGIAWAIWIGVALHITGVLPEVLRLVDSFAFHLWRH